MIITKRQQRSKMLNTDSGFNTYTSCSQFTASVLSLNMLIG